MKVLKNVFLKFQILGQLGSCSNVQLPLELDFITCFWKFSLLPWVAWQLQYSQTAFKTLSKHYTKPSAQVAALVCITATASVNMPFCTGFSSQGRAKLCAFLHYCISENTQPSPTLTRKPCITVKKVVNKPGLHCTKMPYEAHWPLLTPVSPTTVISAEALTVSKMPSVETSHV